MLLPPGVDKVMEGPVLPRAELSSCTGPCWWGAGTELCAQMALYTLIICQNK